MLSFGGQIHKGLQAYLQAKAELAAQCVRDTGRVVERALNEFVCLTVTLSSWAA